MKAATAVPLADAMAEAQVRVERLLKDRRVRAKARALYGHMYEAMGERVTMEDLVELAARLEAARLVLTE